MSDVAYRSEIDGLRGLAVLAVLLFHTGFGLPGGFVGVDVFFVISGFLITSIIQRQLHQQRFSLKQFWVRRLRRIVPALVVVVAFTLAVSSTFMLPSDLEDVGKSAVAQTLAASNFHFWASTGYFSGAAEIKPLLHTWSLAVEEQFYLLLPLILMALGRRRRLTFAVMGVGAVISFAWSVHQTSTAPTAAFFLLPARAWELLVGCLVAMLPAAAHSQRRVVSEAGGWLGLTAIIVPCLSYSDATTFPGLSALWPVGGTALVIWSNTGRRNSVGRLLSIRPLVGTGLISYSLYLWHWPLLALTRYWFFPLPMWMSAALLGASFAIAYLSWRYIESPFRTARICWTPGRLFRRVCIVQTVIFAVGLGLDVVDGRTTEPSELANQLDDWNDWSVTSDEQIARGQLVPLGVDNSTTTPTFLLWGDSHAQVLADYFDELAIDFELSGYAAINHHHQSRLIPRPDEESMHLRNERILQLVGELGIRQVFLIQQWDKCYRYWMEESRESSRFTTEQKQDMDSQFAELVANLCEFDCDVYLLDQVPKQKGGDLFRSSLFRWSQIPSDCTITSCTLAEYRAAAFWREKLEALAQHPQVELLDVTDGCFDEDDRCIVFTTGASCYRDDDHLSEHGARTLLAPVLTSVFENWDRCKPAPSLLLPQVAGGAGGTVVR